MDRCSRCPNPVEPGEFLCEECDAQIDAQILRNLSAAEVLGEILECQSEKETV